MKLSVIDTGYFKLDGGAMFGVVPKQMWKKLNPPDENNMCTWAMRCLLIEDKDRKILIDTGMGDKQDERFRSHFEPHGESSLLSSIRARGVHPEEITDVLLTHLHFDHCGGAVQKDDHGDLYPQFPNATYWSNKKHWDWAMDPNPREKASFLKENFVPLKDNGVLKFIDVTENVTFNDFITLQFVYGHTEAMMIPEIQLPNGMNLVYMADLLPSSAHIRLPNVMSYDIRPLVTLDERQKYFHAYANESTVVMFEHDKNVAFGKIRINEKGRYYIDLLNDDELRSIITT